MQVNYQSLRKNPGVAIEFDGRHGRQVKVFDNPYKARSFYAAKLQDGKNPKVVAA